MIETVNVNDDFFELGGDYLKGIQMIIHLRELFNIDIKLNDLVTHSTVAGLARYIENKAMQNIQMTMSLSELSKYVTLPNVSMENVKKMQGDDRVKNIFITGSARFLGSYLSTIC